MSKVTKKDLKLKDLIEETEKDLRDAGIRKRDASDEYNHLADKLIHLRHVEEADEFFQMDGGDICVHVFTYMRQP